MSRNKVHLSKSLEDYLETIYNLIKGNSSARVKDIASMMEVKMPSVTGAMRTLAAKGLVNHQPYNSVELTDEGFALAKAVADKHSAIKEFLVNTLGLAEIDAEKEACNIEHAIQPETLEKLVNYVELSGGGQAANICIKSAPDEQVTLSQVCPGSKGRVVSINGRGSNRTLIRKRLMDMGITKDAEFEVVRVAPFGDPIEIKLRGYLLSLRVSEASQIVVEIE